MPKGHKFDTNRQYKGLYNMTSEQNTVLIQCPEIENTLNACREAAQAIASGNVARIELQKNKPEFIGWRDYVARCRALISDDMTQRDTPELLFKIEMEGATITISRSTKTS